MHDEAASITDLAGHLRRIAPPDARLARAVFDARMQALAEAAGLRVQRTTAAQPKEPFRVTLRAAGGEVDVVVDMQPYPFLAVVASAEDAALRRALGELMLGPQLDRLAAVLGQPVEVAACTAAAAQQPGIPLSLRQTADDGALAATLHPANDSFAALLEARLDAIGFRLPRALHGLALATRLRLGSRRCPAELLASLRPGDVLLEVLPAGATANAIEHLTLHWGAARGRRLQTRGRIDGRRIIIEEIVTMSVDTVDYSDPHGPGDDEAPSVAGMESLEVPVHLELDTIALPLGRLAALLPGHVVELPVAVSDTQIRLVAYGQTLGVGQLVAVGDNLGLQIVRMFERQPLQTMADGTVDAEATGADLEDEAEPEDEAGFGGDADEHAEDGRHDA